MASLSEYWGRFQVSLIPHLEIVLESPLTPKLQLLVQVLDMVDIDRFIPSRYAQWMGRKAHDRRSMARAFIAKAVYDYPTTELLIDCLREQPNLRKLCGFEFRSDVPSASTFSRAFKEFASSDLGGRVHESIVLTWWAMRLSLRPPSTTRTFGYHRAGILAALVNSITLIFISGAILREGYFAIIQPHPVSGGIMMVVSAVALILNSTIALWIRGDAKNSLNMRSTYLHMLGDALSSVAVLIAGLLVNVTGWYLVDAIVSLGIGVYIGYSSFGVLTEAVNVLMEGAPSSVEISAVAAAIEGVPGVASVHDLHIWSIADDRVCLSCHLHLVEPEVNAVVGVKEMLTERFALSHSTIEVRSEQCAAASVLCSGEGLAIPAGSDTVTNSCIISW